MTRWLAWLLLAAVVLGAGAWVGQAATGRGTLVLEWPTFECQRLDEDRWRCRPV